LGLIIDFMRGFGKDLKSSKFLASMPAKNKYLGGLLAGIVTLLHCYLVILLKNLNPKSKKLKVA